MNKTVRVFKYLGPRVRQFFTGVILVSLFMSLTSIAQAFLLGNIMNAAVQATWKSLAINGAFLAGVLLFSFATHAELWRMFMVCMPLAAKDVRESTIATVQKLPLRFFETGHSGDVISRINSDIDSMLSMFGVRFRRFITPVINSVLVSASMLYLNWRFALILIALSILIATLNFFFGKPMRSISGKIQKGFGSLSGRAIDMLSGISCTKIFSIENRLLDNFDEENKGLARDQAKRSVMDGSLSGMNEFLGYVGNFGALFLGIFFMSRGKINIGTLLTFISLQGGLGQSFLEAAQYFPIVQRSLAGADRLFDLIDQPSESERHDYPEAKDSTSEIAIEGLGFSYADGIPILQDVSLHIPQGKVVALVGESGGGKSTILKLVLGFYRAEAGAFSIRGKPYSAYTLREIRDLCAWVPQDPYLFDGTIEENIRLGRENATNEEIVEAARNANALDFINNLKDGFSTQVGQGGIKLSGGQKQRIAIARVFLKNSPILLLDEATSSLDSRSEQLVQDAIARLMKNRTSIVVAHRLSTIQNADEIYVIDKGRIAEEGTHGELLERHGLYRNLWDRLNA